MKVFTVITVYFLFLILNINAFADQNPSDLKKQADSTELDDDFLGSLLNPAWLILNPNMFNYSVSSGFLNIIPTQECVWWNDDQGPFIYKLAGDDFMLTSLILTRKASDTTLYPDAAWQFGGIMLRDPASDLPGAAQNYIFLSIGHRGSKLQIECKSTIDDESFISAVDWESGDAELGIRREGFNYHLTARALGDTAWQELRTYQRTDLPDILQTGVMAYSFNYGNGGVDLLVKVDNVKYQGNLVPVELESFTGSCFGNEILLKWVTASEINNSGFIVERRIGGQYSEIGYLEGAGTTTEKKLYSFTDNDPSTGTNYYRLRQLDSDGSYKLSNELSVDICPPNDFFLGQNYPNPFNPETVIEFNISKSQHITLSVYDLLGNKIKDLINQFIPAGNYRYNFNAADLSAGVYIYKLITADYVSAKKMVLLK